MTVIFILQMRKLRTLCELYEATLRKLFFKLLVISLFPDTFRYWHRRGSGLVIQFSRERVHTDDAG